MVRLFNRHGSVFNFKQSSTISLLSYNTGISDSSRGCHPSRHRINVTANARPPRRVCASWKSGHLAPHCAGTPTSRDTCADCWNLLKSQPHTISENRIIPECTMAQCFRQFGALMWKNAVCVPLFRYWVLAKPAREGDRRAPNSARHSTRAALEAAGMGEHIVRIHPPAGYYTRHGRPLR